jgi:hypothetical protein
MRAGTAVDTRATIADHPKAVASPASGASVASGAAKAVDAADPVGGGACSVPAICGLSFWP